MSTPAPTHDVTQLLVSWGKGDRQSLEKLIPRVYKELHRLARHYMLGERQGHILQTTALVNEAFLRLVDWSQVDWKNRAHFFGVSAQLMRHILVDYARSRDYAKRGAGALHVSLDESIEVPGQRDLDLLALDDALKALAEIDPRKGKIVELRFFGGLSVEEVAEVLQVSSRTVLREWDLAQAWLHRR